MMQWSDYGDVCPDCGSDDYELLETDVFGFEYTEHYECYKCGLQWADVFGYQRSYAEVE